MQNYLGQNELSYENAKFFWFPVEIQNSLLTLQVLCFGFAGKAKLTYNYAKIKIFL